MFVQVILPQIHTGDKKQTLYNLFAAYVHTMPLEELIESVDRARRDAQLRYVVIYGLPAATASPGPNGLKGCIYERLRSS